MYNYIIIFVVVLAGQSCNGYLKEKLDWIKTCQLSDPEFVKCSTISVQGLFDHLSSGIEGLDEIGITDPMKIDKLRILQGNGPVSVNASLSKVVVSGLGQVKVLESFVSAKDFSWITKLFIPKLRMEGNYHMVGRILVIPLNGRGKCWLEPTNMNITAYTKTKLYYKDDHVFYNVTSTRVEYTLTGLKLDFTNLFQGVKALEDSTNIYLNENWPVVNEAMKPIIAKTIEDILLEILQNLFHMVPGDFLVSDLPRQNKN